MASSTVDLNILVPTTGVHLLALWGLLPAQWDHRHRWALAWDLLPLGLMLEKISTLQLRLSITMAYYETR